MMYNLGTWLVFAPQVALQSDRPEAAGDGRGQSPLKLLGRYSVAASSFFIMVNMKMALITQTPRNTAQTTQSGILPQR